ncbi:hypothetical protein XM47_15805 [Catenovulum maritimum]|uniref:TonB-dependent receptor n=1 Tax=Catenovulum maritimum TaxID=1513271 RepID=A0A0J8GN07_9ALTE|nr:hypothetical protein XM47_15805 [Catenovulum maritimum]
MLGLSTPAFTAEQTDEEVEVISVKGLRGSLMKAQDIKRESSTFVDAISAEDIGALPDRSVLEAMSRVPGVSIERFAAANDPDHFGIEGSGAVIRGMTQTRSEFNGRDTFSANSNRGLSFQDVPPELMGSVKVYKNQSADMIEGGIGGTVNLNTRLPFDQADRVVAISADYTYTDMAEEWSPSLSAMFSDRWQTDIGEFGFLVNLAQSDLTSRSDGLQSEIVLERTDLVEGQTVYAPNGGNMNTQIQDRQRDGLGLAAQWENNDRTMLVTAQFLRSDASLGWNERTISFQTNMWEDDGVTIRDESYPLDGYPSYDYDQNGVFQSGYITHVALGGWRSNGNDAERVPQAADWSGNPVPQFGNVFQTTTRRKQQSTLVEDASLNFKFRPNDTWSHELDIQFVDAETKDDDATLYLSFFANQFLDLSGDAPKIRFGEPWNGHAGGNGREGNEAFLQDKSSYHWRSAMDHYERSEGEESAFQWDTKYVTDSGFITSIKAGVRYAEREQTVKFTEYNWQTLGALHSADHNGDGYAAAWMDIPASADLVNDVENVSWDDHFGGGHVSIPGDGTTIHPSFEIVNDYQNWGTRLAPVASDWEPAADRPRNQLGVDSNGNPVYEEFDSHFRPNEINDFVETNKAAYVRFDFAYDDSPIPFTGNFGGRYVKLERETSGYISFPYLEVKPLESFQIDGVTAEEAQAAFENQVNYHLPQDDLDFANDGVAPISASTSDSYFLPSLNLKFELDDDLIARFAASKAIAYPNTGDMKSFVSLSDDLRPAVVREGDGEDSKIVSADVIRWTGNSGNAQLKPMQSIQYDFSLEWYFGEDSSLTGTLFYKDLKDFWVTGGVDETFTNNGVTNTVTIQKPVNTDEGKMKGLELAYQQFYRFLPAPFDGLGIQANYSYIEASGVPNSNLFTTDPEGKPKDGPTQLAFDELPLAGQSKHTANFVTMYEKNDFSARLAYNWRSSYMITARDVIAPHRPVYGEAAGYLDASMFYNLTDQIKIGIQGVNLLNTITKTSMQVDEAGTRYGRSWFLNDRRYSVVLQAKF